jgi:hypothetical protein
MDKFSALELGVVYGCMLGWTAVHVSSNSSRTSTLPTPDAIRVKSPRWLEVVSVFLPCLRGAIFLKVPETLVCSTLRFLFRGPEEPISGTVALPLLCPWLSSSCLFARVDCRVDRRLVLVLVRSALRLEIDAGSVLCCTSLS